jgi:hypothetical protein
MEPLSDPPIFNAGNRYAIAQENAVTLIGSHVLSVFSGCAPFRMKVIVIALGAFRIALRDVAFGFQLDFSADRFFHVHIEGFK